MLLKIMIMVTKLTTKFEIKLHTNASQISCEVSCWKQGKNWPSNKPSNVPQLSNLFKYKKGMSFEEKTIQQRGAVPTWPNNVTKLECNRCERTGHFGRDPKCTRGKSCNKCGGNQGHFASKCKTKVPQQQHKHQVRGKSKSNIRHVESEEFDDSEEECACNNQTINDIIGGKHDNWLWSEQ